MSRVIVAVAISILFVLALREPSARKQFVPPSTTILSPVAQIQQRPVAPVYQKAQWKSQPQSRQGWADSHVGLAVASCSLGFALAYAAPSRVSMLSIATKPSAEKAKAPQLPQKVGKYFRKQGASASQLLSVAAAALIAALPLNAEAGNLPTTWLVGDSGYQSVESVQRKEGGARRTTAPDPAKEEAARLRDQLYVFSNFCSNFWLIFGKL